MQSSYREHPWARVGLLGAVLLALGGCADLPTAQDTEATTGSTGPSDTMSLDTMDLDTSSDTSGEMTGGFCGNGSIEGAEDCDGVDLGTGTCETEGFESGSLSCTTECTYDTSGCTGSICGDGVLQAGEDCDGAELGGADCGSQGFLSGSLGCTSDCNYDTSECSAYEGGCCEPNPTTGCEDPQCSAAVCDEPDYAYCCLRFWDSLCVERALTKVECQGVGGACPPLGDCCEDNGTPGCEDDSCTQAVCAMRESCCTEGWDHSCATAAFSQAECRGMGTCPGSMCGDGFADATEVCDGDDLAGNSCATLNFDGGILSCAPDCSTFDTSECSGFSGDCCDAHPDPGCNDPQCTAAVCDSNPFCCDGFWDNQCAIEATMEPACLGTSPSCPPAACGDGVAQPGEACDGGEFHGENCTTQGFDGGQLACADDCMSLDTSACGNFSGDCCDDMGNGTPGCHDTACTQAICSAHSQCCTEVWGSTCGSLAAEEPSCEGTGFSCPAPTCGNGAIQFGEQCDSDELAGTDCTTLGFQGGTLTCTPDDLMGGGCDFDTSLCSDFTGPCCGPPAAGQPITPGCEDAGCSAAVCVNHPECCSESWSPDCQSWAISEEPDACHGVSNCPAVECPNDQAQANEVCDGVDVRDETCASQGFGGGTLGCQPDCSAFDTSQCHTGDCCAANGTVGCGDSACESAVCVGEDAACCTEEWGPNCAFKALNEPACQGTPNCPAPECGNGVVQDSETCDGFEVGEVTCIELGYVAGDLACLDDCSGVDESVCWTGDCCTGNSSPGCDDVPCADSVCSYDPYCCENIWDEVCALEAAVDSNCYDEEELNSCPNPQCGDGFAEGAEVCDADDLVGQDCVSQGFGGGTLSCQENCEGFDILQCYTGDCCQPGETPGCEDPACTAAICMLGESGASCCEDAWTSVCANEAMMNPACQGVGGNCPL